MLEKGLFCTFKINKEYILVDVNLSKVITLKPLIKWSSWEIRFAETYHFFNHKFPFFWNKSLLVVPTENNSHVDCTLS